MHPLFTAFLLSLVTGVAVLFVYTGKQRTQESVAVYIFVITIGFFFIAWASGDLDKNSYFSCRALSPEPFPLGQPFEFVEAPPLTQKMLTSHFNFDEIVDRVGNIVEYAIPTAAERENMSRYRNAIFVHTDKNIILACEEHSYLQK